MIRRIINFIRKMNEGEEVKIEFSIEFEFIDLIFIILFIGATVYGILQWI